LRPVHIIAVSGFRSWVAASQTSTSRSQRATNADHSAASDSSRNGCSRSSKPRVSAGSSCRCFRAPGELLGVAGVVDQHVPDRPALTPGAWIRRRRACTAWANPSYSGSIAATLSETMDLSLSRGALRGFDRCECPAELPPIGGETNLCGPGPPRAD
jgi:hypothetical protein